MHRETITVKLIESITITPLVRHLIFAVADDSPFEFTPGQFITFHFTLDDIEYQRSYSVASISTETKNIEIAVSPSPGGPGTTFLFGLNLGDKADITGPFGRLVLRDEDPQRYILVATGTGVTPYRAMLPELLKRINESNLQVEILLGVQKPEDLLYAEDFIKYADKSEQLKFHKFYSRAMPENPNEYDHQGYVQTGFEQLKVNPEQDVVYLCGNPNMIDEAFKLLREKGFATSNVRREKYISPKQR